MSLVLLKLVSGLELVGHDTTTSQREPGDPVKLTTAFVVVTQQVGPDKIQIGLVPVSVAAAEPSTAVCKIHRNQIIAELRPSELLRDAHRSATGQVAVARAPVLLLDR